MSVWYKAKKAQVKLFYQKQLKQAQKLALAVVVLEYVLAGGYWYLAKNDFYGLFSTKQVIIYQAEAKTAKMLPEAQNEPISDFDAESVADVIYRNESSKGKNDQKCERGGLGHNGYGFGQYKGHNLCLESDNAVRVLVIEWINEKHKQGLSENEMLCLYNTGTVSSSCEYVK
jgi:hypothetical protein